MCRCRVFFCAGGGVIRLLAALIIAVADVVPALLLLAISAAVSALLLLPLAVAVVVSALLLWAETVVVAATVAVVGCSGRMVPPALAVAVVVGCAWRWRQVVVLLFSTLELGLWLATTRRWGVWCSHDKRLPLGLVAGLMPPQLQANDIACLAAAAAAANSPVLFTFI